MTKPIISIVTFMVIFSLLPLRLWAACTGASPTWTSTPDYSSLNTCVGNATAGDTINVSEGSATWDSTLTINKALNLIGAGSKSTTITRGIISSGSPIINISPSSDVTIRVSGFRFEGGGSSTGRPSVKVSGKRNGALLTKIRIDHNYFNKGGETLSVVGGVYGCIDNNTFLNGFRTIYVEGDDNYAWARSIAAGTANALFIEDNTILADNNAGSSLHLHVYHQDGTRTVFRYNHIDTTSMTNWQASIFDIHGNLNPYTGTNYDMRGPTITEIYNNKIEVYDAEGNNFFVLRGGSILMFNNTITETQANTSPIVLEEEEGWTIGGTFGAPPAPKSVWPAEDQINNSFFWNNTYNGSSITDIEYNGSHPKTDAVFIQQDRDYFMHAPASTGGKESYTGRPGAAGRGSDGTLTFSSSESNAYYPYTPYTYPHPLRGSSSPPPTPSSPQNLRIIN